MTTTTSAKKPPLANDIRTMGLKLKRNIHAHPPKPQPLLWNASIFKTLSPTQRFLVGMAIVDAPKGFRHPGDFGDDTQKTLRVMEALLEAQRDRKPLTRELLARHFIATSNGAATRSIPFGMISDIPTLIDYATLNAELTHRSCNAQASSVAVALMAHYYYFNIREVTLLDFLLQHLASNPEFQEMADHLKNIQALGKDSSRKTSVELQTAAAVFHLLSRYGHQPQELLRQAKLLGGDTDSVAALSLGIAAIRLADFSEFPDELVAGLSLSQERRAHLLEVGKRFRETFPRYHGAVFLVTNETRTRFFLQQKKSSYPHYPQGVSFFGGKVEFGEAALEAALRERDEELSPEAVTMLRHKNPKQVFHGEVKAGIPGAEAHCLTLFEYVVSDAELDALATLPVLEGRRGMVVNRADLSATQFVWGLDQPMQQYLAFHPDRSLDPDYEDIQKTLAGDPMAFRRLYRKYENSLRAFCQRKSPSSGEDIAQLAFLKAHQILKDFEFRSPFKSWLFGIAKHLLSHDYRTKKRRDRIAPTVLIEDLPTTQDPPNQDHILMETQNDPILFHLNESLQQLSPQQREIVRQRLQEIPEREIAETLGIPVGTVSSSFSLAKASLKILLDLIQSDKRRVWNNAQLAKLESKPPKITQQPTPPPTPIVQPDLTENPENLPRRRATPKFEDFTRDSESLARLPDLIQQLAPRQQQVAQLKLQGLNEHEIAQRLGIPTNTVRSNLHCVNANLEKLLQKILV